METVKSNHFAYSQIRKIGNSRGLIIPQSMLTKLGMNELTDIIIICEKSSLRIGIDKNFKIEKKGR